MYNKIIPRIFKRKILQTDQSFLRLDCVKLKVVQIANGIASFNCSDVDFAHNKV